MKEATPRIRHTNQEDTEKLKRLIKLFSRKLESKLLDEARNFRNFTNKDNLLGYRKTLLEKVKQACLERDDDVTALLKSPNNRPDTKQEPYVQIALLAAVIDYHCDEELKRINNILGY